MGRHVKVAAIQMNVKPAPLQERLSSAGDLVQEAVQAGAELIVLPELFNSGYAYSQKNYNNAETIDGPTMIWMQNQAKKYGVYIAGTILIKENRKGNTDIRNALLLFCSEWEILAI